MLSTSLSLAKNYGFGSSPYLTEHSQVTRSNTLYDKYKDVGSGGCDTGSQSRPSVCNTYVGYEEPQSWNKNRVLGRNPCNEKCCNDSALPLTDLHREILSSQNCIESTLQHVPTVPNTTKAGYYPFRPNIGLCGEDFYEGKSHMNYNSSYIPPSLYHLSQEDPYLVMNTVRQHSLPMKGTEWDSEEEQKYPSLDYCNNEMFFNLCPLRWSYLSFLPSGAGFCTPCSNLDSILPSLCAPSALVYCRKWDEGVQLPCTSLYTRAGEPKHSSVYPLLHWGTISWADMPQICLTSLSAVPIPFPCQSRFLPMPCDTPIPFPCFLSLPCDPCLIFAFFFLPTQLPCFLLPELSQVCCVPHQKAAQAVCGTQVGHPCATSPLWVCYLPNLWTFPCSLPYWFLLLLLSYSFCHLRL